MLKRLVKCMKRSKVLLYYLLEFILTILVFITILLLIIKVTILNKNYIKNKINSNDYVHELYVDIKNDFNDYIIHSGFDNNIVDNLFSEDELKIIINKNVDSFYKGEAINVDTDNVKNKLEDNINNYLSEKGITVNNQKDIDLFVKEILKIYKERIVLNDKFIKLSNKFSKLANLINIFLYVLMTIDLILFLVIKKVFKKITLTILKRLCTI